MTTQKNRAGMSLEPGARRVPLVAGDPPAMRGWVEQQRADVPAPVPLRQRRSPWRWVLPILRRILGCPEHAGVPVRRQVRRWNWSESFSR